MNFRYSHNFRWWMYLAYLLKRNSSPTQMNWCSKSVTNWSSSWLHQRKISRGCPALQHRSRLNSIRPPALRSDLLGCPRHLRRKLSAAIRPLVAPQHALHTDVDSHKQRCHKLVKKCEQNPNKQEMKVALYRYLQVRVTRRVCYSEQLMYSGHHDTYTQHWVNKFFYTQSSLSLATSSTLTLHSTKEKKKTQDCTTSGSWMKKRRWHYIQ